MQAKGNPKLHRRRGRRQGSGEPEDQPPKTPPDPPRGETRSLTVLVCAALAQSLLPPQADALINAFVKNLPIEEKLQTQILTNIPQCVAAGMAAAQAIQKYQTDMGTSTKTPEEQVKATQDFAEKTFTTVVAPGCSKVYEPMVNSFRARKLNKMEDFNYYIVSAFQPEVLGTFSNMLFDILMENPSGFGERLATLFKIVSAPPNAKFPVVPIRFHADIFAKDFAANFLSEMGFDKDTINRVTYCLMDITQAMQSPSFSYYNPMALAAPMERCSKEVDQHLMTFAGNLSKMLTYSSKDGASQLAALRFIYSLFTNNHSFIQSYSDLGLHLSGAQYGLAGRDLAHLIQAYMIVSLHMY